MSNQFRHRLTAQITINFMLFFVLFRFFRTLMKQTDAASVVVHVINGEHPAAMQYGNSSATSLYPSMAYHRRITTTASSMTILHQLTHHPLLNTLTHHLHRIIHTSPMHLFASTALCWIFQWILFGASAVSVVSMNLLSATSINR